MSISATEVNKLRQQTGAGLMDCKQALTETNGNIEAAIDYLRKKGQKISASRANRAANEGAVIAKTSDDGKKGVAIYLSCETDFVAKNDGFIGLANSIADLALEHYPDTVEQLLSVPLDGVSLGEVITQYVGKIGEKMELVKYENLESEVVIPYIHAGNKIGVLIGLNQAKSDEINNVGKDVAMQIAAMAPIAVDKDGVDQSMIDRELDIAKDQAKTEGKPEEIVDKIATGKLQKFFKENTLVNQQFVKDSSKTVETVLKEVNPDLKVDRFIRIAIGS